MRPVLPLVAAAALAGCVGRESALSNQLIEPSTSASSTSVGDRTSTDTGAPVPLQRITAVGHELHPQVGSLVYVRWQQASTEPVRVEYSVDPGVWLSSPVVDGQVGANETLLVGIPFAVDGSPPVPWRVVAEADGMAFAADEGLAPAMADPDLPLPRVVVARPDRWDGEGDYLLTSINQENGGWTGGRFWVVIYDREGRPVWAQRVPNRHWSLFPQLSVEGDTLLWDEATKWSDDDDGEGSVVHRTYLDREVEVVATPGLHHGFVELPSGGLAWGSQSPSHGVGESVVQRLSAEAPAQVIWRCEDWLAEAGGTGACEANALFFEPAHNSFLVSLYTHHAVLEVDRASGASLWWAGGPSGGLGFSPPQSQFVFQHGANFTNSGNLLLSSEYTSRTKFESTRRTTVAREYKVDVASRLLVEEWSHDSGIFASTNGHVERTTSGNTLHLLGSASQVVEVNRAGETAWHLDFEGSRLLGRGELLPDLYDLLAPSR